MLIDLRVFFITLALGADAGSFHLGRTHRSPAPLRLAARTTSLENLCDDLDKRVDYLAAELKSVRGRQFALEKREQEPAGPANDEQPAVDQPKPVANTAFLARRFRGF